MTGAPTIPVTVLTGFLGSGKTTVLNHLLHQPDMEGVVAIINEFGEIGLDHLLVETSEERFALLDNGCVCCSVREDLVSLLTELSSRGGVGAAPIRRVLIETTGLADPVPVLHTLMTAPSVIERYRIDGVVVTVDAVNAIGSLDMYAEAVKQIAVADRILLTKSDLVDEAHVPPSRNASALSIRRCRSRMSNMAASGRNTYSRLVCFRQRGDPTMSRCGLPPLPRPRGHMRTGAPMMDIMSMGIRSRSRCARIRGSRPLALPCASQSVGMRSRAGLTMSRH